VSRNDEEGWKMTQLMAIGSRCIDCNGGGMADVRNCEHDGCELQLFRMGRGVRGKGSIVKPTHRYCLWCMGGQTMEVTHCPTSSCPLFAYRFGYGPRDARHSQKYGLLASIPDGTDHGHTLTATIATEGLLGQSAVSVDPEA